MSIANTYPVFEADQVLTNNHLNDLFNFLNQQNRSTRNKLIGSGIVCGLEISHTNQDIVITKGCALTSQGFLLTFCETPLTHFIPYNPPGLPGALQYIRQCGDGREAEEIAAYYKKLFRSQVFRLVREEQRPDFPGTDLIPLSQVDLSNFIVVLYLEAEQLNLKNCDTNDCNDKGSRMDFDVMALLVPRETIDILNKQQGLPTSDSIPPWPVLKRYNMPVQNLSTADAVLSAFRAIADDKTIDSIAEALKYSAVQFNFLLDNESANTFDTVDQLLKKRRDEIAKNSYLQFQYFYDHLDDLIKAYREFVEKAKSIYSQCCLDEMLFPLHILLGEADKDTVASAYPAYRQHFIYSPLFDTAKGRLAETRSLFTRLKLLVSEFNIRNIDLTDRKEPVIRITPSRNGHSYLSRRSIPYYYNAGEKSLLHHFWDFDKTSRGHQSLNLGYNASDYGAPFTITNALQFDIEPYDFFRVEGHVGQHINSALSEVKQLQHTNNLPFEVVSLSADYIGVLVKGEEPKCVIQDLESDYRILIAEFICTMHDVFCKVGNVKFDLTVPFKPATFEAAGNTGAGRISPSLFSSIPVANIFAVVSKEEEEEEDRFLSTVPIFQAVEFERPFISNIITEAHFLKAYQKGDTLARLCNPGKNTVGGVYLSTIRNNRGQFLNPSPINRSFLGTFLINGFFELIDRVESLFEFLMNNELSELDIVKFKAAYDHYETIVKNVSDRLEKLRINPLVFLNTCFVEKLEALHQEYVRRTAQYRLAKSFSYYFSRHGGVEHKAGVPRGGTFILVYHEERRSRIPIRDLIFANREIATLVARQIPGLIEKETSKTELETKTQDLQEALATKDPELSLRLVKLADQFTEDCDDMTAAQKKALKALVRNPLTTVDSRIADGIVIADFYIPYMCCSDCPPIAYIIPEKTITPTISLDKSEFCNDDSAKYEIRVQPAGGKLTLDNEDVNGDSNSGFFFEPKGKSPKTYKLIYKIENQSANASIVVKAPPSVRFKANSPKDSYTAGDGQAAIVAITSNASADAINVFDFGDGFIVSTNEKTVSHVYLPTFFNGDSTEVIVKVTVTDGPCKAEITKSVKIFRLIIL